VRILLFLILLAATPAYAQSVGGVVRNGSTGEPIAGVKVTDMITQSTSYTDATGHFSVTGNSADPVLFSAAGYATVTRKVPVALGSVPWRVDLQLFSVTLKEVLVRPHLSGYTADSVERRSTYQRALARQKSSPLSPVSFLAERLSKKQKALFRFQKEFVRMENDRYIDSRYTADLASQMTGLQGDTLARFMNENPMPLDYARAASELELKMWIRSHYREWILLNPALAVVAPAAVDTTAKRP
jgi:hypothetical protein